MDIPAGIMRKVQANHAPRSFCEIPAHVVAESPFDVALDLGFNNPRSVRPNKDNCERDENPPQPRYSMSSPECEGTTSGSEPPSEIVLPGDTWNEEEAACGSPALSSKDSESRQPTYDYGRRELKPGSPNAGEVVVDSKPNIEERVEPAVSPNVNVDGMVVAIPGEGRVRKGGGGCTPEVAVPVNPLHPTPVDFISASYYVERPSKQEPFGADSRTRRSSFCRIEAFVIHSRAGRATPVQHAVCKKATTKSRNDSKLND